MLKSDKTETQWRDLEAHIRLRNAIDIIEKSTWMRTRTHWGERTDYVEDDDRRDEALRELKTTFHLLTGVKL